MDGRLAILDDLSAALEDVLAALGGNGARERGAALDAARVRADTAFLRLRAADFELGDAARPYPEEMRSKVEAILRMDALVQSLAADAKGDIERERAKLTQVRGALRQHASPERTDGSGRSCDVRG